MSQERRNVLASIEESEVKIQVLMFFYHNPFTVDDLDGVAMWVGMHKEELAGGMEELCQAELLVKRGSATHAYYSFTEKPELVEEVHRLVERFRSRKRAKAS